MKKLVIVFAALMAGAFAFASCDKNDGPVEPPITSQPSDTVPKYTVTVRCADGWGTVSVGASSSATTEVREGAAVTITATPADGCEFVCWTYTVDGESLRADAPTFEYPEVRSDMSFTAVFSRTDYEMVFEDDFEQADAVPDPAKWTLCDRGSSAWCKHMSESYDQAYVRDGRLVLVAEKVDGEYRAGGVRMLNDLGFMYGRVEVAARFAVMAQGSWPAIWMMPSRPMWSGWPQCGEIDIMEHLNRESNVWNVIHSHYVDNLGHRSDPVYSATPSVKTSDVNVYAIDWTEDAIKFSVNGKTTLSYPNLHLADNATVKQWPFDAPFYLILNNALGGAGTWPGNIIDSQLPSLFEIEYVKVMNPIVQYSETMGEDS